MSKAARETLASIWPQMAIHWSRSSATTRRLGSSSRKKTASSGANPAMSRRCKILNWTGNFFWPFWCSPCMKSSPGERVTGSRWPSGFILSDQFAQFHAQPWLVDREKRICFCVRSGIVSSKDGTGTSRDTCFKHEQTCTRCLSRSSVNLGHQGHDFSLQLQQLRSCEPLRMVAGRPEDHLRRM